MKRLFPEMYNSPGNGIVFGLFACWMLAFVFFPFLVPLLCVGSWNDLVTLAWVECIYHAVNGLLMAMLLKEHLSDTLFYVQSDVKGFVRTVVITLGLMLVWYTVCEVFVAVQMGQEWITQDVFPLSEMQVTITTGYLITNNPIAGTICMTLFTPFAFCGLFYGSTFAPVCRRKPWLAYPLMAVVLLLPVAFEAFWWEVGEYLWISYFLSLPIHMLACWSYQKTDGPWAPVAALAAFNLLTALPLAILG